MPKRGKWGKICAAAAGVFADRYELETDAPEVAFLTAFVIAIDNIRDDRKR